MSDAYFSWNRLKFIKFGRNTSQINNFNILCDIYISSKLFSYHSLYNFVTKFTLFNVLAHFCYDLLDADSECDLQSFFHQKLEDMQNPKGYYFLRFDE